MDSEEERVAVVTPALEGTGVTLVAPAQECTEQVRTHLQEPIKNGSRKPSPSPCTPSRPIRRAVAASRTPEGELSSRSCEHQEWVDFHTWNQTYYTEDWLKRETALERYPLVCSGNSCGKRFVHKNPTGCNLDKLCKVTNRGPVHVCPNAAKPNHQCTFALCHNCFGGFLSGMLSFGFHCIQRVEYLLILFCYLEIQAQAPNKEHRLAPGGGPAGRVTRSRN
jgi:hypothetical protein